MNTKKLNSNLGNQNQQWPKISLRDKKKTYWSGILHKIMHWRCTITNIWKKIKKHAIKEVEFFFLFLFYRKKDVGFYEVNKKSTVVLTKWKKDVRAWTSKKKL